MKAPKRGFPFRIAEMKDVVILSCRFVLKRGAVIVGYFFTSKPGFDWKIGLKRRRDSLNVPSGLGITKGEAGSLQLTTTTCERRERTKSLPRGPRQPVYNRRVDNKRYTPVLIWIMKFVWARFPCIYDKDGILPRRLQIPVRGEQEGGAYHNLKSLPHYPTVSDADLVSFCTKLPQSCRHLLNPLKWGLERNSARLFAPDRSQHQEAQSG